MSAPTLEPVDEAAIRARARGQIDDVRLHSQHATRILEELRLAAENLLSIHQRAMSTLDTVPDFNVKDPEAAEGHWADPQNDVRLSATVLHLLGSFGSSRMDDLVAGIDATQAALGRYADVAEAAYDREFGKGWVQAGSITTSPGYWDQFVRPLTTDPGCPVEGCEETGDHGFVAMELSRDGHGFRHVEKAPSASGPVECCASGSCEVCRGEVR